MLLVVVLQDISGFANSKIFAVGETFGVVIAGKNGDVFSGLLQSEGGHDISEIGSYFIDASSRHQEEASVGICRICVDDYCVGQQFSAETVIISRCGCLIAEDEAILCFFCAVILLITGTGIQQKGNQDKRQEMKTGHNL